MTPFQPPAQHLLDAVVAITAAYVLVLPLAVEREKKGFSHVGLRTLPLVSVGACAYLLLSRFLVEQGVFSADGQARSLRALMTGIGFIGGGAILRRTPAHGVGGITTAASVWTTGAIGAALAYGYYSLAAVLALASLLVIESVLRRRPAEDHEAREL
jgi:putative Mg2+ transporter-C (MgtC) family protein